MDKDEKLGERPDKLSKNNNLFKNVNCLETFTLIGCLYFNGGKPGVGESSCQNKRKKS
jgi:hypothetical protein